MGGGLTNRSFLAPPVTPPMVSAPRVASATPQTPDLKSLIAQGLFSTAPPGAGSGQGPSGNPGLGAQATQTTGPMTDQERNAVGLFGALSQTPTTGLLAASTLADMFGATRSTTYGNPAYGPEALQSLRDYSPNQVAAAEAANREAEASNPSRGPTSLSEGDRASGAPSSQGPDAGSPSDTGRQGTDSASGQGADAAGGGAAGDGTGAGSEEALGGVVHATKATTKTFGEDGPEVGLFVPDDIAKIPPKKKKVLIEALQEQLFKLQGEDNGRSIQGATEPAKK